MSAFSWETIRYHMIPMAFVNFSLLLGGTLLAIPIVLHLVMRQQPKQLVFPALRFIKQRQDANRRQLQLRHWLLLFLRCLAIALLAVALARPSVPSLALGDWILTGLVAAVLLLVGLLALLALFQRRGRWVAGGFGLATLALAILLAVMLSRVLGRQETKSIGNEQAPVAAVLAFDTSPRMQYLWQNQTRLDKAREIAQWLVRQLPGDSEMAVLDSRPGGAAFAVDLAAAQRSVERLETTGVPLPLVEVAERAIKLTQASQKPRKEVYLFSDLSRAGWTGQSPAILQQRLRESPDVLLYVIDVGVDQPQNTMLGVPVMASDVLPKSDDLELVTKVECLGAGGTQTVELYLEEADPELPVIRDGKAVLPAAKLRAQQVVELPENGSQTVRFRVSGSESGDAARDPASRRTGRAGVGQHPVFRGGCARGVARARAGAAGGDHQVLRRGHRALRISSDGPGEVRLSGRTAGALAQSAAGRLRRRVPAGPRPAAAVGLGDAGGVRAQRRRTGLIPRP